MADLKDYQAFAIYSPFEHMGFFGGVACGKTFTGAHFALECIEQQPELTGLIGANNHDQLSQATLRELFYWLDEYKYEYIADGRPPGQPKRFKTYKNILSIRSKKKPKVWTPVFTRIMSMPNPLRGIEFSWYWLDESRDTPENTHDVVLSRMRESRTFRRGLLTSTTNGEDWAYKRFVLNRRRGQRMYGSMHIPTYRGVEKGFLDQSYYDMLRATYSELMAMQELDALHVNVRGGRAYYAFGAHNELFRAPWGDAYPSRHRPLIIGCDFNFTPSPCVWMVGQIGPSLIGPRGENWTQHIHWFGEISGVEKSTPEMTQMLINQYPGYFLRIFGDSSGMRGSTSNAGKHDYQQMGEVLWRAGVQFTIDAEQFNPLVKDRVENMNRLARNAVGETRMTYNPHTCPLFQSDVKVVGWKKTITHSRTPRLDDGGDKRLTHATDGGGYAVFKVFPPRYHTFQGSSMPSPLVDSLGNAL